MAEPARKYYPEDILPEDAVVGPGTFQNVDNGRVLRKDHFGPIPPSGESKRYIKLSDDPTYGLSPGEAEEYRKDMRAEESRTSYDHPSDATTAHTGEIVSPGTYRCTNCGNEVTFKQEGHMPPCSQCAHTEWSRSRG